jgi:hypothetical protein
VVHTEKTKRGAGQSVGDVKDYLEARDNLAFGLGLAPLDIAGLGMYKGAVTIGSKFFAKVIANGQLAKALRAKGLPEHEVKRLIAEVQDTKDVTAASKAANRIVAELDIPTEQMDFARAMERKKLISETDEAATEKLEQIFRTVPAAERPVLLQNARQLLERVNSAKINNGNRAEVIDVMMNAARFGMKTPDDAERIGRIVSDWDEGLDGLARTFEIASKKMNDPKIRGLASVQARQDAAFKSALDDLRASNPSLKAMPDSQWAKMRDEMTVCPMKPGK